MAAEFYFNDPRLEMTTIGRLIVRSAVFMAYSFLSIFAGLCLVGDIPRLQWVGAALALFLIDRFWNRSRSDYKIADIGVEGRVNIASYAAPHALRLLEKAFDKSTIGKTDLLLELISVLAREKQTREVFLRLDVPEDEFLQKIDEFLAKPIRVQEPAAPPASESKSSTYQSRRECASALMKKAFEKAVLMKHASVEPEDLFLAAADFPHEYAQHLFSLFSIEADSLKGAIQFSYAKKHLARGLSRNGEIGGFRQLSRRRDHRTVNRAWTSRPTPTLDASSRDLTDLARGGEIGFLIGHKGEYEAMASALARSVNPNVLLIGDEGIGKESLVAHLALQIVEDQAPRALFDRRLVMLDISALFGAGTPEEFSIRIQTIAKEIIQAGNIILYIPDIHQIVKTATASALTASDALLPIIRDGEFPVIGGTYPREFTQLIEPRGDIVGLFEAIRVREISEGEAEEVLVYEGVVLEKAKKVFISYPAIKSAVALSKKYLRTKPLPSSAVELLKEAVSRAVENRVGRVSAQDILKLVETKVNVPIHAAGVQEASELLHLEDTIHKKLVDQNEAVGAVSDALRQFRSGLSRRGGPIASFLFIGPTGVGKTELAKSVARIQFGAEKAMVRFDMTEYQDKQSFFRFIGSPDGSVSGQLTESILHMPYALILLDEFEKAHPDILNLFLQVLDDGRLTDNIGRTVDFQNTIIIATSNAHSDFIVESLRAGKAMADIGEEVKRRLVGIFRPELINRFSKVVVFKNLSPEDVLAIAKFNIAEVASTLEEQGIYFEATDDAIKKIAELGFDPAFGARPLRQVIADKVRAPLSRMILEKAAVRGSRVRVATQNNELVVSKVE